MPLIAFLVEQIIRGVMDFVLDTLTTINYLVTWQKDGRTAADHQWHLYSRIRIVLDSNEFCEKVRHLSPAEHRKACEEVSKQVAEQMRRGMIK